jgi:hypothetical protein
MMSTRLPDTTVLVRTKTREIEVMAESELIVQWSNHRPFKPSRFVIAADWDQFRVLDLRVGKDSQFPDPKPRAGRDFQPDGPPGFRPYGGEFDTALPCVLLTAKLFNTKAKPMTLRCHWLGVVVVEADRPLEPADELEVL